ncbi:increased DNA methylation 3-like isoform X2 [Salvia miltiorrhiza]|uniref:increased DNA methylation 3-like isoform X2 n=1 Tax=Salvia miltiorrhiza TaxID=226208 RepID=UPI0025AB686F|nr:increased DNA methylation 3-like isoform X2 [Salvia miltiorrhiza]XP_057763711.1 increased DNA methylation 3-like isoform X2 [Salvia miltiorrhiza]
MENMSYVLLTDDQHFLLYLIMGAYFAPDLKEGSPLKSALQRRAEGLGEYLANDLASSRINTTVMENVYYYVLRKAEPSVVVKQSMLLDYIHGSVPITLEGSVMHLQFDDLFPPMLHHRSECMDQHSTIDSIVLISNPQMSYLKPCDLERFKRLTGLEDLHLDCKTLVPHISVDDSALRNTMQQDNVQPLDYIPGAETYPDELSQITASSGKEIDQGMLFLPSCPTKEEWSNLVSSINGGFALTGSAARGHLGPVLGLIDIGEATDSYLFRVSLPGVKRDANEFSCEVGSDGAVIIKGVTVTGERVVEKYAQVFEMRSQNLCPPGPFCISFRLPGPVDPQQFHGTFATDGILEGIALKARRYAG